MKKVAILYSKYSPTIDAIKFRLDEFANVEIFSSIENFHYTDFDLVILSKFDGAISFNAINIHHSILPAFVGKNPVKDAVLYGSKLTGLTVYYTDPFKIITQYPIFIYNDAHFDELENELEYLEQTIYPLVIEKVLKNEPFEIQKLMSSGCGGNCRECGGCKN